MPNATATADDDEVEEISSFAQIHFRLLIGFPILSCSIIEVSGSSSANPQLRASPMACHTLTRHSNWMVK